MTQTAPRASIMEIEVLGAPVMSLCDDVHARYPGSGGFSIDLDHQAVCALMRLLGGEGLEAALAEVDDDHPGAGEVKTALAELPDPAPLRAWLAQGWPQRFVQRYEELALEHTELENITPVARALWDAYNGTPTHEAIVRTVPGFGLWLELWVEAGIAQSVTAPAAQLELAIYGADVYETCNQEADVRAATDLRAQAELAVTVRHGGGTLKSAQSVVISTHPAVEIVHLCLQDLPDKTHLRAWLSRGWPAAFLSKYLRLRESHPALEDMTPVARALRDGYRGLEASRAVAQHIPGYGGWIELWYLSKEDFELAQGGTRGAAGAPSS